MMPGQRGQRDRVPSQHAMQQVVRREHFEQPCHGGPLEFRTARWLHAGRPAGRHERCHDAIIISNRTQVLCGSGSGSADLEPLRRTEN